MYCVVFLQCVNRLCSVYFLQYVNRLCSVYFCSVYTGCAVCISAVCKQVVQCVFLQCVHRLCSVYFSSV